MTNIALYHPWIHFRDDNWVKASLLFWERLERIVPLGHPLEDSPAVTRFAEEGLIVDVAPDRGAQRIGDRFAQVIQQHEEELRTRFGMTATELNHWHHSGRQPDKPFAEGEVVYIHLSKIEMELQYALIDSGLATSRGREGSQSWGLWLGVHPEIARVYLTLLANEIAADRVSSPVSENETDLVCSGEWSVEALTAALLGTSSQARLGEADASPAGALAFLAMQSVIPTGLSNVPVEKILDIRTRYEGELRAFRQSLQRLAEDAELAKVTDPEAFESRLHDVYESEVQNQLPQLEADLSRLGLSTVRAWLNMKVTLPPMMAAGVGQLVDNEAAGLGSAVVLGLVGVAQSARSETRSALQSPASYLLRLDRNTNPQALRQRARNVLQRLALGV